MTQTSRSIYCKLCGSAHYYLLHESAKKESAPKKAGYTISESELEKPDKVVRCLSCRLVYAVQKESILEIVQDYEQMVDLEYLKEEKGRRAQGRLILDQIAHHKKRGRMLEIGCGPGFFLDEAKKAGWEVEGLDLSAWAKEHAEKNYKIPVRLGDLKAAHYPDRTFDVIVMNDVLEHLEDPKDSLGEIRRILKNDGIIYISTPDINSFLSRALKARWWGINKYHLFYFSRQTLETCFKIVGFKTAHYYSYPRVFSFEYWHHRLKGYPRYLRFPFDILCSIGGVKNALLKIVLHDQIGVVAKKIQRLDSVIVEDPHPDRQIQKQKVTVVLPAYNAEKTLERTVADIPKNCVDEILLVDDKSRDGTVEIAKRLGLVVYQHEKNRGYGGNQKTCYAKAVERGADVVVMCHPDYQYDPKIIPQLIEPILKGQADAVFGSRMMKGGALEGGMPLWKHNANILLTAFENVMLGTYLTEYHSGFRAYSAKLLNSIDLERNSDNFIFDTEIIAQIISHQFKIEEVPIRTRYFEEASSIKLWPSIVYGLGILRVMLEYFLHTHRILRNKRFRLITPAKNA